jgi:hypothetical protein
MQSSVLASTREPRHLSHAWYISGAQSFLSSLQKRRPMQMCEPLWARLSFNQGKQNAIFAGKRASRSHRFEVGKE